jgi:hypothetical protein
MTTFDGTGRRTTRETRVGDYRRGSRIRTTAAGTWFPALGPDDQPAGLLLVHPGVDLRVLLPTLQRLDELNLPGVLPAQPDLLNQAGRNWLVTLGAPAPVLGDLLDDGPHRLPGNAAAVLRDLAATLVSAHQAGLVHGRLAASSVVIGPEGTAQLTDWATNANAGQSDDVAAWTQLARLFAERWCADAPEAAAALARAVGATAGSGLAAGFEQLADLAGSARRDLLAEVAAAKAAGSSGKAGGSSGKAGGSSGRSAGSSGKPAGSSGKPAGSSGKPAGSSDRPTGSSGKPAGSSGKPASSSDRPTGSSGKSTTARVPELPAAFTRPPAERPRSAQKPPSPQPPRTAPPAQFAAPAAVVPTPAPAPGPVPTPTPTEPPAPGTPDTSGRPAPAAPGGRAAPVPLPGPVPPHAPVPPPAPVTPPRPVTPDTPVPPPAPVTPDASAVAADSVRTDPPVTAGRSAEPQPAPVPGPPGQPADGTRSDRAPEAPAVPDRAAPADAAAPAAPGGYPAWSPPERRAPEQPPPATPPGPPPVGYQRGPGDYPPPQPPFGHPPAAAPSVGPDPYGRYRPPTGSPDLDDGAPTGPLRQYRAGDQAGTDAGQDQTSKFRMVLIAVLVVALALASALLYLRVQRSNATADLQVQSVTLQSEPHGNVCMLYATLTVNGKPGTVTYRWTSDQNVADPVQSVSVGADQEQLVIGRGWMPDSSGTSADPLITIQVLSPTPGTASTQPAASCQR